MPEYYEDLKKAAYTWAHDEFLSSLPAAAAPTPAPEGLPAAAVPTLPLAEPDNTPAEPGDTPPQEWKAGSWKALQALYTKHVVPDELIKLWTLDNHINGAERTSVEMQRLNSCSTICCRVMRIQRSRDFSPFGDVLIA